MKNFKVAALIILVTVLYFALMAKTYAQAENNLKKFSARDTQEVSKNFGSLSYGLLQAKSQEQGGDASGFEILTEFGRKKRECGCKLATSAVAKHLLDNQDQIPGFIMEKMKTEGIVIVFVGTVFEHKKENAYRVIFWDSEKSILMNDFILDGLISFKPDYYVMTVKEPSVLVE